MAALLDERRKEWDRATPHFLFLLQKFPGSLARGLGVLLFRHSPLDGLYDHTFLHALRETGDARWSFQMQVIKENTPRPLLF